MRIKAFPKKYIFVFLTFCVQELLMNLLGEYNKTFLAKSILNGKYIVDMLWTLLLYSAFVFTAVLVIFLLFFKERSLLYSVKKKLLGFAVVTVGYECAKFLAYLFSKDNTQSIYFVLGNLYLFAVQIVIYNMFSEIDTANNEKKPIITKKQVLAITVIMTVAVGAILAYEITASSPQDTEIMISSRLFISGFVLAFATALIQTVFFGMMLGSVSDENLSSKGQFILFGGAVGIAAFLWSIKTLILPEGVIIGMHQESTSSLSKDNTYYNVETQTEWRRCIDHEDTVVYQSAGWSTQKRE